MINLLSGDQLFDYYEYLPDQKKLSGMIPHSPHGWVILTDLRRRHQPAAEQQPLRAPGNCQQRRADARGPGGCLEKDQIWPEKLGVSMEFPRIFIVFDGFSMNFRGF